jgi:hypothetical protein
MIRLSWIWISTGLVPWIRIRTEVQGRNRICIEVKTGIRIRTETDADLRHCINEDQNTGTRQMLLLNLLYTVPYL